MERHNLEGHKLEERMLERHMLERHKLERQGHMFIMGLMSRSSKCLFLAYVFLAHDFLAYVSFSLCPVLAY